MTKGKSLEKKYPYWGWDGNAGKRCKYNDNTGCTTEYRDGKLVDKEADVDQGAPDIKIETEYPYWGWGPNEGKRCKNPDNTGCDTYWTKRSKRLRTQDKRSNLEKKYPHWGWGGNDGKRCMFDDNTGCYAEWRNGQLVDTGSTAEGSRRGAERECDRQGRYYNNGKCQPPDQGCKDRGVADKFPYWGDKDFNKGKCCKMPWSGECEGGGGGAPAPAPSNSGPAPAPAPAPTTQEQNNQKCKDANKPAMDNGITRIEMNDKGRCVWWTADNKFGPYDGPTDEFDFKTVL